METKSRYEVIADLEEKKRELIRERDQLDDEITTQESNVISLEREKENLGCMQKDFELKQKNALSDLDRDKEEFDLKVENTSVECSRKIEDAKLDIEHCKSTVKRRTDTINELIKGVEQGLEKFNISQSQKK